MLQRLPAPRALPAARPAAPAASCLRRRVGVGPLPLARRAALLRDEAAPYTGDKKLPEPFAVPAKLLPPPSDAPGSQHSVLTETSLRCGEMVMACRPLGAVYSAPDAAPDPSALLQLLRGRGRAVQEQQVLEAMARQALRQAPGELVQGAQEGQQEAGGSVDVQTLQEAIRRYSSSGPSQDLPSCVLRGEEAQSYCGIWPAAACLPHSCVPSTHEYLIADTMCVRASTSLPPGSPLTRNYLGMQTFAPLAARRALLKDGWGLHCTCARCTAEERNPTVQQAVQAAYDSVQALSEEWAATQGAGDVARAAAVQAQAGAGAAAVESALRAASLSYEEEIWLGAGALALTNLQFSLEAAATGSFNLDAKEQELRCLEALATGSEAHVYAALNYYVQVLLTFGEQCLEEERAQERVNDAHVARYGLMDKEVLGRLSEVRFNDVVQLYTGGAEDQEAEPGAE